MNKLAIIYCLISLFANAQVGIGTVLPEDSASLEISGGNRGVLINSITLTGTNDTTSIVNFSAGMAEAGLLIYNTSTIGVANAVSPGFYYWDGTIWVALGSAGGSSNAWDLSGNTGTTSGVSFIGTTDNQSLDFRTNNTIKTRITTKGQIEVLNTGSSIFLGEGVGRLDDLSGNNNVGVGHQSLYNSTTGNYNVSVGSYSLYSNTTGYNNTATGAYALYNNTSGSSNVASGLSSLRSNTSGYSNAGFGNYTLYSNVGGSSNSAMGESALHDNISGWGNTAVGRAALYNSTSNTNSALGASALYYNTTGASNVAVGAYANYRNTTGSNNTSLGKNALYDNTTGASNIAIGAWANDANTTGSHNVGVGQDVMSANTTGSYNVGIGSRVFNNGAPNLVTGSYNTGLGYSVDLLGDYSNSTVIGYNSDGTASNQVRIGNSSVTSIGGYQAWTDLSDGRYKKNIKESNLGLEFILNLRPVTYHLDIDKLQVNTEKDMSNSTDARAMLHTGFIAQEVDNTATGLGVSFSGVDKPKNNSDRYGLRYSLFVVPLVKAVQEQQELLEKQDSKIISLENKLSQLEDKLDNLLNK